MQRKQASLVSTGELDGPPQARHSFTVADQVDRLVCASEADPDRGFMARTMALCSPPRSNPGNRHQYKRVNGPFTLVMSTGGLYKLPFGNLPRLILAWVSTEAVKTQSREDPKPRAGSREIAGRLHAGTRHLQQQRRKVRPATEPNEPALQRTRPVDLQRRAGRGKREFVRGRPHRVLVERAQARRAEFVGKQDRTWRKVFQRDHQPALSR